MMTKEWQGKELYSKLREFYILDEDCHYSSMFHIDSEHHDGGANVVDLFIAYNHDFYNPEWRHSYLLKKDGTRESGNGFILNIEKLTTSVFRELIYFELEVNNFNPAKIKIKQSLEKTYI